MNASVLEDASSVVCQSPQALKGIPVWNISDFNCPPSLISPSLENDFYKVGLPVMLLCLGVLQCNFQHLISYCEMNFKYRLLKAFPLLSPPPPLQQGVTPTKCAPLFKKEVALFNGMLICKTNPENSHNSIAEIMTGCFFF